jgi:hypothetical protein
LIARLEGIERLGIANKNKGGKNGTRFYGKDAVGRPFQK